MNRHANFTLGQLDHYARIQQEDEEAAQNLRQYTEMTAKAVPNTLSKLPTNYVSFSSQDLGSMSYASPWEALQCNSPDSTIPMNSVATDYSQPCSLPGSMPIYGSQSDPTGSLFQANPANPAALAALAAPQAGPLSDPKMLMAAGGLLIPPGGTSEPVNACTTRSTALPGFSSYDEALPSSGIELETDDMDLQWSTFFNFCDTPDVALTNSEPSSLSNSTSSLSSQNTTGTSPPNSLHSPFVPESQSVKDYAITGVYAHTQCQARIAVKTVLRGYKKVVTQHLDYDRDPIAFSGCIYVVQEGKDIKRWVDGHKWTQSRKGEGPGSLVYREKQSTKMSQDEIRKLSGKVNRDNCEETLFVDSYTIEGQTKMSFGDFAETYVGALQKRPDLLRDGLVKRTYTVVVDANNDIVERCKKRRSKEEQEKLRLAHETDEDKGHRSFLVVSYYSLKDICNGRISPLLDEG